MKFSTCGLEGKPRQAVHEHVRLADGSSRRMVSRPQRDDSTCVDGASQPRAGGPDRFSSARRRHARRR